MYFPWYFKRSENCDPWKGRFMRELLYYFFTVFLHTKMRVTFFGARIRTTKTAYVILEGVFFWGGFSGPIGAPLPLNFGEILWGDLIRPSRYAARMRVDVRPGRVGGEDRAEGRG